MKTTIRNVLSKGSKKTSKPKSNALSKELAKLLKSCETLQDLSNLITSCKDTDLVAKIQEQVLNKKISLKRAKTQIQEINQKTKLIEQLKDKVLPLLIECAIEEQNNKLAIANLSVDQYRYKARFRLKPCDLPFIKGYQLLCQYGFYNRRTNPGGVVRDHRFSVNMGYKLGLPAELLSNISNCEFLLNADNIRKSDNCSITLEELKSFMPPPTGRA